MIGAYVGFSVFEEYKINDDRADLVRLRQSPEDFQGRCLSTIYKEQDATNRLLY